MRLIPIALLLAGCIAEPADYRYGEDLTELTFAPLSRTEGVYPDPSILDDPNNAFAGGIGEETKWEVFDSGPVHGFYAMGTALVQIPTGEHQVYTATAAQQVYEQELAEPSDLWLVREIAVGGYRAVLEHFLDDVTFDATGTYSWSVAPIAYQGLVDLGGDTSGYALITDDAGQSVVVELP